MASVIVVPLKARARTIGALFLVSSRSERRYGPADVAVVQPLADQAALAMDNARLYREAQAAAAEARQVRHVFETFMERSPAVAYMKDDEGRLVYANRALERLTGRPIAELLGRTDAEIFPESADRFHAHDLEAMTAGRALEFHETTRDADGSERQWISLKFPFSDPSGRRLLAGLSVELTEQRRAEAALERLMRQHELILDSAGEGIFGVDLEGRFTFVNPAAARMLGWTREELVGRPQHELVHHTRHDGSPYPRDACPMYRAVRDGIVCHGDEELFWRRDGTSFPIAYTATPLLENGRVAGKVVTFQDTSERKTLEGQVRQAQKMEAVGRLAGGIAHDFNNLMTAVTGFAELALARMPQGSRLRNDIEEIRRAGERAASLTRQLLAFSRRQVMEPRLLDLNAVVAGMEQMLRRVIGEHIQLATSMDPALRQVRADPGQIEQVLMNLALNARDAMPAGGTLTIETANADLLETGPRRHEVMRPGQYTRLAVSDTGCGMDADTRTSAFEPFFTTKELGKGTGLGLATVYGIVKQSGGYVWVDSEPGRGAAFTIYLPSVDDPAAAAAATPAAPAPRPAGGRESVLVVEDDEGVREVTRRILAQAGYAVLGAADGDEALAVATRHEAPIALLLTDLVMPGGTGPEVAARVSAARPGIRVLFTSGYADSAVLDRARLDARDAFIAKPFTSEGLLRKVRDVLDAKPPVGPHPTPRA
jgi:PAS domain S-box-containing protein